MGDLQQDYQLLQRISWKEPEVFWPQMLKQLRIKFARPPTRSLFTGVPHQKS